MRIFVLAAASMLGCEPPRSPAYEGPITPTSPVDELLGDSSVPLPPASVVSAITPTRDAEPTDAEAVSALPARPPVVFFIPPFLYPGANTSALVLPDRVPLVDWFCFNGTELVGPAQGESCERFVPAGAEIAFARAPLGRARGRTSTVIRTRASEDVACDECYVQANLATARVERPSSFAWTFAVWPRDAIDRVTLAASAPRARITPAERRELLRIARDELGWTARTSVREAYDVDVDGDGALDRLCSIEYVEVLELGSRVYRDRHIQVVLRTAASPTVWRRFPGLSTWLNGWMDLDGDGHLEVWTFEEVDDYPAGGEYEMLHEVEPDEIRHVSQWGWFQDA